MIGSGAEHHLGFAPERLQIPIVLAEAALWNLLLKQLSCFAGFRFIPPVCEWWQAAKTAR